MRRRLALVLCLLVSWSFLLAAAGLAAEPQDKEIVNGWGLDLINAPEDLAAGDHPVRVALIDSGVRMGNPYLQQDRIAAGYNYVLGNTVTNDLIGHGTQTAGIIIGASSEERRLVGLCNQATLVPLVVTTKYASGVLARADVAELGAAIRDAVDTYDCQIINLSIGVSSDEPDLRAAVAYAEEQGVIVIAAVGNTNLSTPDEVYYPAAYPTVVGVGSVDQDSLVSGSSQRNGSVMVTAPGEGIYSLAIDPTKEFEPVSGTSYSTAIVSGFAALLRSYDPDLTPAEYRQILQSTAQDLGEAGYDTAYGYGLIDVSRGLALCAQPTPVFADVSGWYAGYVSAIAARGIITGRSATTFAPFDRITRAEFVAILARISKDALPAGNGGFSDVKAPDWFSPYVCWAAQTGVATGHDGEFHPDEAISRQDMAVMLARFAEKRIGTPLPAADATFADRDAIAEYARSAVGQLQRAGIISGNDTNRFEPEGTARRCEAAKVAALLLQLLEGGS